MSGIKKVRVLEISHGLAPGGIEAFLLNVFDNIDKEKIELDFAVACQGKQYHEQYILDNGGKVYHTADLNGPRNIIKHFFRLIRLLKKEGPFDVVHTHIDFFNGINLLAAFIAGVPIRIAHSHNTNSAHARTVGVSRSIKIYRKFMRILINTFSTLNVGCSSEANIYMYGEKNIKKKGNNVIFNGIDLEKFSQKDIFIKDLDIDKSKINFVTVGRMCEQKNSIFIVKVINEINKLRNDIHLYWLGKGPDEEKVINLIESYKLNDVITLLGNRKDVGDILSNMDYMIFPSKWEGLPVTLVEAQAAGLSCFISDKITKEADLGLLNVISLQENEFKWAEHINKFINEDKKDFSKANLEKFNIKNVSKQIDKIYLSGRFNSEVTYEENNSRSKYSSTSI